IRQTVKHIGLKERVRPTYENFKSYGKRKLTLNLTKGLTVISGPNGCGKSNISDAIQFVIGQLSSKTIRSDKLSGVIFAGTREGQKTAPYAKVTLALDNSAEPKEIPISTDEVHISRKVYIDGRSEYFLNGSRITRNEIIDTISMCGISIDGYNVIRQGEIANFSNMSPLQVRGLLEEIAGIASYDEKKEKAEKNLEDAKTKLRIATVRLEESMKNLSRLEKEKEDALRYQELNTRIKSTEAKLVHARIRQFKQRVNEIILKVEDLRAGKKKSEETIKQIQVAIKSYDDMLQEAKAKVKDATTQTFNTLTEEIEKLAQQHSQKNAAKHQIESELEGLKDNKTAFELELEAILEENVELEKDSLTTKEQLEGTDITLKKIQEELDIKRQMLDSSKNTEIMDQLEEIRSNVTEMNKRKADIESQLAIYNNNLNILNSKIDEREKRIVEVAGILANFLSRKAKYMNETNEYNELSRSLDIKVSELKEELQTVEAELSENEQTIRDVAINIKRIQTELETTKRIMEEMTNRDKGIKLIIEAREKNTIKGIYGTVGELCKTHPQYSIALNVTAGSRSDFVVVEDDEVAAKCVMLIKNAKAGRLTFLPLNKIKPIVIKPDIKDKGIIGRALDLVEFDEKFRVAAEFVFGQTLVVKNLDAARRIGFTYRAVTIDGDVVNPTGAITGGFYRGQDSTKIALIVEDEAKLPQLQEELATLQEDRKRLLQYRTDIAKELNEDSQPRLSDVIRNRELRQRDITIIEEEIELRSKENIKIQGELETISKDFEELEIKIEELLDSRKDLGITLETLLESEMKMKEELDKSGIHDILDEIKSKEGQQGEIANIINELKMEHYRATADINKNRQTMENLKNKISELEKQEPIKQEKLNTVSNEAALIFKELEQKKTQRQSLFALIEESQKEQERLEEEQKNLRRNFEEETQNQNNVIITIERLINEKGNAENQIEELEQLAVERDLPYIFAEDEIIDVDVLREVLSGLKVELDNLPEINMKAVSQYEEELGLNNELVEKRKFVEKDYEAISQAISDIENEKREKFMGVFNSISKDFNKIFGILSPDGRAKVELEDPDDPFNGGVHIMANPGGKKITSMLSLSGGEKSLTALAMIFAIQRYKPAPFYVFDEIDAFLDINNVNKVAALIREMSSATQIIVISLRAPMIAAAKKIFGVTAGDDRISQIVSVSLDEIMKIVEETDLPSEAEVYDY
ncbi:MAG: chromosome segregation protein SMC, partial [Candidatus Thorarchaeota archaeon]